MDNLIEKDNDFLFGTDDNITEDVYNNDNNDDNNDDNDNDDNNDDNNDDTYGFNYLIDRVYDLLESRQKEIIKIPSPIIEKYGGRKCIFTNCKKICDIINRKVDQLFKIICSELSVEGSINADNQIILKGKFYSKHISRVVGKYINKYVKCSACQSLNTQIYHKNGVEYLDCNNCLSKNPIDF